MTKAELWDAFKADMGRGLTTGQVAQVYLPEINGKLTVELLLARMIQAEAHIEVPHA